MYIEPYKFRKFIIENVQPKENSTKKHIKYVNEFKESLLHSLNELIQQNPNKSGQDILIEYKDYLEKRIEVYPTCEYVVEPLLQEIETYV